jgi:Ca2+-binding EF-hand superfamily protein
VRKKGEITLDELKAVVRAFFDPKPMTEEEVAAASAAMDNMAVGSMTFKELDDICKRMDADEQKGGS